MITFDNGETKEIKWLSGKYKVPVTIKREDTRLWLSFPFNKQITADIKECFDGYKWHGYETPPIKKWSVRYCQHNLFQLEFFACFNPYAPFDSDLPAFIAKRPELMKHQLEIASHILHRRYSVIAGEMGTGKTLAAIEAMEASGIWDWLWVAPRAALYSVMLEFKKWNSPIQPNFVTYSGLKRYLEEWPPGKKVHQGMICDESSKCKTPTAQRTQCVMRVADSIRLEWGNKGIVALMTGSPAPKSPADWYAQCEAAYPGFIKEGDIHRFKKRLAVIVERESDITGGSFPHLVTWRDDENKCAICGEFESSELHTMDFITLGTGHPFQKSENEVFNLYKRMSGLVLVKHKKDCLDLPDKVYRVIRCKPSNEIIRTAKLICARATGAKALGLLRELSDGFQYTQTPDGVEQCPACLGTKVLEQYVYIGPGSVNTDMQIAAGVEITNGPRILLNPEEFYTQDKYPHYWIPQKAACPNCKGLGEVTHYIRTVSEIKCPKDQVLIDLLEEHDDVGRLVTYAGFTGSVDRCFNITKGQDWHIIKVDGRGWSTTLPNITDPQDMLKVFQDKDKFFPRINFIGHPGSAGMGLTLTASPSVVYYSNDFNAESRIQSEDRIHRPGMDANLGATIIDIVHLETDQYVIDNLQKKRDLQSMTLGDLSSVLEKEANDEYYGRI